MFEQLTVLSTQQAGFKSPVGFIVPQGLADSAIGGLNGQSSFSKTLLGMMLANQASSSAMAGSVAPAAAFFATAAHSALELEGDSVLGDRLRQWLARLENGADLEQELSAMSGLAELLQLAQVIVEQRLPGTPDQDGVANGSGPDNAAIPHLDGSRSAVIRTVQLLLSPELMDSGGPEWKGIVQSIEQLLAKAEPSRSGERADPEGAAGAKNAAEQLAQQKSAVAALNPERSSWLAALASRSGDRAALAADAAAEPEANTRIGARSGAFMPESPTPRPEALGQTALAADPRMEANASGLKETNVRLDEFRFTEAQLQADASAALRVHNQPAPPETVTVNASRLPEEAARLIRSMSVTNANGLSEIRISLVPEHLGHIQVKITYAEGQIAAILTADTAQGKELLEGQLSQLRAVLHSQGLSVDRLEVAQSDSRFSGMFHSGMFQQDSGQRQQQYPSEQKNRVKAAEYDQEPIAFSIEPENGADMRLPGERSIDISA
jgi:flagellar hook-length control protein FliK